jgi:predicted DNA-binding transcriptional regulator AlpA
VRSVQSMWTALRVVNPKGTDVNDTSPPAPQQVFARMSNLVSRSGLSRSLIYRMIKEGKLPKPQMLPNSTAALYDVAAFDAALRLLLAQGRAPEAS